MMGWSSKEEKVMEKMTRSHNPKWEWSLYFQCSRIDLLTLLSAYYIYQVREENMCNKNCISTTMTITDKGLVSSIVSCQMNIRIVNSKQCNSIIKINQTINRERRKQNKRKEKNYNRSCSGFSNLYSVVYFLLWDSTEDVCTDR